MSRKPIFTQLSSSSSLSESFSSPKANVLDLFDKSSPYSHLEDPKDTKISINLACTRYHVLYVIAQEIFNWQIICETKEKPPQGYKSKESIYEGDIIWVDTYIQPDTLSSLFHYQKINHFPGSQNLGRKDLLARNLNRMIKHLPELYDFFPQTWNLPLQYEELRRYMQSFQDKTLPNRPIFILKPEASCQGKGISLFKKLEDIESKDHHIIQKYIPEPYLIDGLKFDLRIYVLVRSVEPLRIYIYKEGLARFATVQYAKPKKANLKNVYMHLTNYAVNKKNPDFKFNEETLEEHGHKRSMTSIFKYLKDQGIDSDKVFEQICDQIVKTILSVQPSLARSYKACQPRPEDSKMCFELFGFDILLDANLKPWLLEVNHTPSFHCDSKLDLQVKKNLLLDTLAMVNNGAEYSQKGRNFGEQYLLYNKNKDGAPIINLNTSMEDKHIGNFQCLYPSPSKDKQAHFRAILNVAIQLWKPHGPTSKIIIEDILQPRLQVPSYANAADKKTLDFSSKSFKIPIAPVIKARTPSLEPQKLDRSPIQGIKAQLMLPENTIDAGSQKNARGWKEVTLPTGTENQSPPKNALQNLRKITRGNTQNKDSKVGVTYININSVSQFLKEGGEAQPPKRRWLYRGWNNQKEEISGIKGQSASILNALTKDMTKETTKEITKELDNISMMNSTKVSTGSRNEEESILAPTPVLHGKKKTLSKILKHSALLSRGKRVEKSHKVSIEDSWITKAFFEKRETSTNWRFRLDDSAKKNGATEFEAETRKGGLNLHELIAPQKNKQQQKGIGAKAPMRNFTIEINQGKILKEINAIEERAQSTIYPFMEGKEARKKKFIANHLGNLGRRRTIEIGKGNLSLK